MSEELNVVEGKLESDDYLESVIDAFESTAFPLYFQKTTANSGVTQYAHALVMRAPTEKREEATEENSPRPIDREDEGPEGTPNSPFWKIGKYIFDRFCAENGIQYSKIFRASINVTHYFTDEHSEIHFDHYFRHRNFVFYLNDFSHGSTLVFDDDGNVIKELKAERLKGVSFDAMPHAQQSCGIGERRMVLVVTYI